MSSTTVHVQGISSETSEKEIRDFFSFCGKISNLSVEESSSGTDGSKSAKVDFEKETAAKTALLLDNTQLGRSQIHVTSTASSTATGTSATSATAHQDNIDQEDKPRSRIVAEYLAHGYALSDQVIQNAIALDNKHGISNRFTQALSDFDGKYKATDKARAVDQSYGVSDKASSAWNSLSNYYEQAMGTPTGQKVRSFYVVGDKQVRDIHTEARRLADLKAGKSEKYEPEHMPGTDKTHCQCAGSEGVCGCAPGTCACSGCNKSTPATVSEYKEAAQAAGEQATTTTTT